MPKNLKALAGTPLSHGFTFPAEWERHSATWFSWPRPEGISFPSKYHTVPGSLASIIREIAPREIVHINVPNENYERIVREQLIEHGVARGFFGPATGLEGTPSANGRIRFHFIPTNESWCRDHGPAFVVEKPRGDRRSARARVAIVDWGFNAWGGKYPPFDADDAVPTRIAEEITGARKGARNGVLSRERFAGLFLPRVKGKPVVMEGGSVEFNGAGTVMTSESCLLHENRNPHLSKREIEKALKDWYGQSHVVWLGDGIVGDDTDGHIDDLARFIAPDVVVTTIEDDPADANYHVLKDNLRRLQLSRGADGRPFKIVTIPMPGVVEHEGQRLPATYANFYFVNGALLVPTYRHKRNDRRAIETLQAALEAIPRLHRARTVIGIDCTELIWGLGSIHCLTQQQPAV
jgi:agmatine deiminase